MVSNKKKILYVITKSALGGAGIYVRDLAVNVPRDEYDVSVALGGDGPLKDMLERAGIRTISLDGLGRDVNPVLDTKIFFDLVSLFRKEKPDIVHLNSSKIGGLGSLAGRIAGVPRIIFTAHGWYFNEDRNVLITSITWILSLLTQLFAHITITVSNKEQRGSPIPSRAVGIHNGIRHIDYLDKHEAREKVSLINSKLDPSKPWIGTIAELHRNKGLSYLIRAVADIPNVQLVIIGEGEERESLSNLIDDQNVSDRVFLVGQIEQAAQYVKAFDIFALTSTKEGLAYVILEAGMADVPVVASEVGGIPEIIANPDLGCLVGVKDVQAIQKSLHALLKDSDVRAVLGSNLHAHVDANFSHEEMLKKTLKVYSDA